VAFVCALAVILAQDFGSVTGQVTDPSGAVVVGAGVQLSNPQTGYTRQSKTDLNGRYLFAGVPFGSYQLSVQSPGFVTYQQAISVSPKAAVKVDVVLNLGSVSETVEVRASGSVLNTASAQISGRARTKIPAQGIRRRSGKFNTEQYDSFQENEFAEARRKPLSTFSADVDTASYSNVRRFLRDGELPPADSVRIEELINYFSYDYAEPAVDAPFSVTTGVAVCPWQPQHKLVHLGLRTRSVEVSKLPPANLVFLIDVSGSMDEPKKLPLVKESLRLLVEQLREQDRVGIVVYAGAAGMVLAPTPGNEKARILGVIDTLTPGGSTHGSQESGWPTSSRESRFCRAATIE
jgi:Ca-activated chloride channel family protein